MAETGNSEIGRFTCSMPTRVIFGANTIDTIGEEAKTLGTHAMVVAAAESMEKIGALKRVTQSLESAGLKLCVCKDVQPDPTVESIDRVADRCSKEGCDLVIGLGGGSAIDFAKGVAVGATHTGSVLDYMHLVGRTSKPISDRVLPIIAVPTTAGTGAEVTAVAVMTIPVTNEKHGIIDRRVFPRVAIVDPTFTLSVPPRVTAGTGFDALPHGESAAVCLPESMETMLEARADRFALVADAMGFSEPGMNVTERAQRCVAGVRQLRKAVGLEIPLREFGISSDDLDQVAQDVFETQQWSIEHHPCELSKDDVRGILQTCL